MRVQTANGFKDTQRITKMNKRQEKSICFTAFAIILAVLLAACSGRDRKAFYEADISDTPAVSIRINRYERALFKVNPFVLRDAVESMQEEYSIFLDKVADNDIAIQNLYNFITDPHVIDLYIDSDEKWPELDALTDDLQRAFRFYSYHFPGHAIPEFYTYISGVDYTMPVAYANGAMAIGLDAYLGSDYEAYDRLGIPRYLSRWMIPERIPVDVMHMMAELHMAEVGPEPETLLDFMVYHGKKQFFVDCMLPRTHDTLKIAYTGHSLDWMMANSGGTWTYKLDNELLYTKDHRTINSFVGQAPFTTVFGSNSAPRTGVWLGWQIVRSYMQRNPEVSLPELLAEKDSRKILHEARFRP